MGGVLGINQLRFQLLATFCDRSIVKGHWGSERWLSKSLDIANTTWENATKDKQMIPLETTESTDLLVSHRAEHSRVMLSLDSHTS